MKMKKAQSMNIICLLLVVLFSVVKSDLPVHCLVSDIEGNWIFSIEDKSFSPSLKDEQTTCGRGFPGKVEENIGEDDNYPFEGKERMILDLRGNFTVFEKGSQVGTWTPVYDQSFLIYYKDSILTTSYKYYKKTAQASEFTYDCGRTMVGWLIRNKTDLHSNWSCFHAKKERQSKKGAMALLQTQIITHPAKKSFVQLMKPIAKPTHKSKSIVSKIKYEDLEPMVKQINEAGLTWKAELYHQYKGMSLLEMNSQLGLNKRKTYFLQEDAHTQSVKSSYPSSRGKPHHQKQQHISMVQMHERKMYVSYDAFLSDFNSSKDEEEGGVKDKQREEVPNTADTQSTTSTETEREKDSSEVTDFDEMIKYINTPIGKIDEKKIAKNWDWRNVAGIDYVGRAEKQGNCGSCYIFSTIRSLQSRLRIKTLNEDKTEFSIQFPLSCNFYSEGCHGGYPILLAKFLSEFELVPRSCYEYLESNGKCSDVCDYTKFPKKYIVSDYGYLGGFYGGTSEADIMKEIRARGPIPGNMIVPASFNFYKSGIFSTRALQSNSSKINKWRMVDNQIYYQKVEHSILLVGYGEEKGVKYWIGLNTWGGEWGENGFFKILRGENENHIETMGDYFNIKVIDR